MENLIKSYVPKYISDLDNFFPKEIFSATIFGAYDTEFLKMLPPIADNYGVLFYINFFGGRTVQLLLATANCYVRVSAGNPLSYGKWQQL